MWIRSAFWVGVVKPGAEQQFIDQIDRILVPGLGALPGVARVSALWPKVREDDPPQIACQVLVEFKSRADVERMIASPERLAMRPQVLHAKSLFDGTISHIEYEVGPSESPAS
jgi:hypothetical protein